jgi:PRC-barrel domain
MLRGIRNMQGFSIEGSDGVVGELKDLYFDDAGRVIRYLVFETGEWLQRRRVLVSPIAVERLNWAEKSFRVSMSQAQVRNCPDIDIDLPVSDLRSANTVMRYSAHATDGIVGQIRGLIVDDNTWAIRFLVVDTSSWFVSLDVLIPAQSIEAISATDSTVSFRLTRHAVRASPLYDARPIFDSAGNPVLQSVHGEDRYQPKNEKCNNRII